MISSAVEEYGYVNDDILSDAFSGLSNFASNIGEILGPIFAGVLIDIISYETTMVIAAFGFFTYGFIYLIGSGLIINWISNKNKYA